MTLLEIQNQLINYFSESTTFSLKKDLRKVNVSKEQEKLKSEIITVALDNLADEKFCIKVDNQDGEVLYIAVAPLATGSHTVLLGNSTGNIIAQIMAKYNAANNITDYVIDPLAITDNDIRNVCILCVQLLKSLDGGSTE